MIARRKLLSVFKLLLLLICISAIALAGYVYVVINEVQNHIAATKISKASTAQVGSTLEAETKIKKSTLEQYLLFSEQENYQKYLAELLEKKQLEKSRSYYFINENIELSALRVNNCGKYRCVQNRVAFKGIPSSIWKGLLGTEDFRFLEHRGVDPVALLRALVVDIIAMKFVQGGSTLTQQLVKNMFLTSEKKLIRKFKEMIYAIYIENILDKEDIVTLYLNEMEWGVYQGIKLKGFYSASLAYFNKRPNALDEFEATILVSFLKGPAYYHPVRGLKRMKGRAQAVYERLQKINLFSKDNDKAWNEDSWEKWSQSFEKRNLETTFYSYFLASNNEDNVIDAFDKIQMYESISAVRKRLKERTKDADVAVKILIANKECTNFDCKELFSYYSKYERDKRKAMSEEFHQVGSLLKPIVYESFVELGRNYDEMISTKPLTLKLKSGSWSPKDYSKAKGDEIELKVALQKSKNIPLVRVAEEIGFDVLEKNLAAKIPRLLTPLKEYPAQLLGALELSMEDVLKVYGQFIEQKCQEIKASGAEFEKTVLHYMSVADETTISKLAKPPLKNANVFGKTGTSNNGLDNWYFAFDGKKVYVLYFGVESGRDKLDLRLTGAVTSYMIFQEFMNLRGKQISEVICD